MRVKTNTSAHDHLKRLPEYFTLNQFVVISGMSYDCAKNYLTRWKSKGLVKPMGPKSGYYFNLLKNEKAGDQHIHAAIQKIYPSAVQGGAEVLHDSGWVTQIPTSMYFHVLSRPKYTQIDGVTLLPRPERWYTKVQDFIDRTGTLPVLKPEMVLVDSLKSRCTGRKDIWCPYPDDLYIEPEDALNILKAAKALNFEVPEEYGLLELLGASSTAEALANA